MLKNIKHSLKLRSRKSSIRFYLKTLAFSNKICYTTLKTKLKPTKLFYTYIFQISLLKHTSSKIKTPQINKESS